MMALVIASAIVIGMLTTSSLASANLDVCAQPSVKSQKSVWHALCDLQQQIDSIEIIPGPPGPPGKDGILNIELIKFEDVQLELGETSHQFSCKSPEQTAMAYGSTFGIRSAIPEGDDGWTLKFLCSVAGGCTTDVWLKCISTMP